MIFYEQFKENDFVNLTRTVSNQKDLEHCLNSEVTEYYDGLQLESIIIPKQNLRGFVSVAHIKNAMMQAESDKLASEREIKRFESVEALLIVHNTTISSVIRAIELMCAGRRLEPTLFGACEVISENQKKGTGSWSVFYEYLEQL